jgi:hypothetical protein
VSDVGYSRPRITTTDIFLPAECRVAPVSTCNLENLSNKRTTTTGQNNAPEPQPQSNCHITQVYRDQEHVAVCRQTRREGPDYRRHGHGHGHGMAWRDMTREQALATTWPRSGTRTHTACLHTVYIYVIIRHRGRREIENEARSTPYQTQYVQSICVLGMHHIPVLVST